MRAYTNINFVESEFPLVLFPLMLVLLSVVQRCKCRFHAVEYQEYGSPASLDIRMSLIERMLDINGDERKISPGIP